MSANVSRRDALSRTGSTPTPITVLAVLLATGLAALGLAGSAFGATGVGADPTPTPSTEPLPAGTTGPTGPTGPIGEGGDPSLRDLNPVRLVLPSKRIRFGKPVRFRGTNGRGSAGRVRIQLRLSGREKWRTVDRARASANGRFRGSFPARFSGRVRAIDGHGRASRPVRLAVRSVAKLKRVKRTVKLGDRHRVTGTVRPRGVRRVKVRIKGTGKSVKVLTKPNGRFALRWKPREAGDVRIRARVLPDRLGRGDGSGVRRVSALRPGGASYFGPGLYGNGVACGGTLSPGTRGVAHKTLPCGTKVTIQYGKRIVTARVIDRGPYIAGRDWDLTTAVRNELGFGGVGTVWTNK